MRVQTLLLTLSLLLLQPLPGLAQSQRHPTDAEIQELLRDLRQKSRDAVDAEFYQDRRSSQERQQRDALVKAWSRVDQAIAPFLGNWVAIEENLMIFPAKNRGEVCIIGSYLDITDFYLGKVVDGILRTDMNLTYVLDSGFLVSTFVVDNQPGHYEYANPLPLENPLTSRYYTQLHPKVVQQFRQAGCKVGMPK
jgi:hypothetical protein